MSYQYDKNTKDIVIGGFETGIAENPYDGCADIRNMNLISIPKEASVNFATALDSNAVISSGTVVSADAGADTITITGATGMPNGSAVLFSGGSLPAGITAGVVYWLSFVSAGVYNVNDNFNIIGSPVNITGNGTGTFTVYNLTAQPKYFVTDIFNGAWMIDGNGYVWTTTASFSTTKWRFTGNITSPGTGQGLGYYVASDNTSYIFAFKAGSIDYQKIASNGNLDPAGWQYGWNPATGTTGNTGYLKNSNGGHATFIAPDNVLYYCDGAYIGRFFEQTGKVFSPVDLTTYVADTTRLLPFTDTAQCLSFLGTSLMIGGKLNVIYPWDTTSPTFSYPLFLAEYNVWKMVTVNTTMYILVGNRGRIYYTNGTNAQLWKKIPDHISGTIEPYYTWGGLASQKNQIYFSASVTTNAGGAITGYGGLWAVDVDTRAIRLVNKLSYGTYLGYATAITSIYSSQPAGTGLYIGWDSGASTYGIDKTVGTPYTGGEATLDSDLIPIGTALKPTTNGRVEFKLSVPIVSGESVKLQYRQAFSDSFVDISSTTLFTYSTSTAGGGTGWNGYSGAYQNVNFENSQWIQIRAVLTSTASSPSYCRLIELRLGS